MAEGADLADNLRCTRTDGKRWRCKRGVLAGKKYCEDHLVQFQEKAQRKKQRVKLEAKVSKSSRNRSRIVEKSKDKGKDVAKEVSKGESSRKRSASEALDETIRNMKLKRGDIQLELIREYLIRKVEKKKEESESGVRNIIKDFPNGRMEIPPPSETPGEFDNVGPYNVKIGTNCKIIQRRHFRSKNVEPVPVCTMQILPSVKEALKFKKGKRRKCHWCRKSSYRILVRCKGCQKESFCEDCIGERSFVKEEVRIACPVCRGTCKCKACSSSKPKDVEHKESMKDTEQIEKLQQLKYLIQMLLPVLKKMNLDHSIELEIEAKIKGARNYEIPQVILGGDNLICCNCNTSIVDYHRSCTRCSYKLCISCCHKFRQGKISGDLKENKIMYPYRKRACTSNDKLPSDRKKNSSVKQDSKSVAASTLSQNWNVYKDGRISCPPKDLGGCGGNISLDLRCLYPFGWDKELEASVKDIISKHDSRNASNFGSCCSLCRKTSNQGNRSKLLLETAKRDDSNENFLYHPNVQDFHVERLGHFQTHWGKGQPVIVQSVIQVSANRNWDPVTMFCTYLGKVLAKKVDSVASTERNYLDCFEVELSESQIFMGSLEGQTNAFMDLEKVKINGCLLPNIFQEYFPEHYAQVMQLMPLKEYMDPMSGLLNLAAKFPENMPKANAGPSVHIAYGEPEESMQGQFVTRLSYDSHDVVNILVHATDILISKKELNRLKRLLKLYADQDHSRSTSKAADQPSVNKVLERTSAFHSEHIKDVTGKSSLRSEITEESILQDRAVKNLNKPDKIAKASTFSKVSSRGDARSTRPNKKSDTSDKDYDLDSDLTIFCSGTTYRIKDLENECLAHNNTEGSSCSKAKPVADSCGAQWDIFRRQDVPQLLEYLRRHCDESIPAFYNPMHVVHPIFDNSFYFDAFQKMRLKKEFNIEPWTFEQKTGEAVIIPAGCPYQFRKLKSSVNVIMEFISPENALECTRLADEIRSLPLEHKARQKFREVEKMTLHGISSAICEVRNLTTVGMASSGKDN
ncbi:lysine-specific demethylase JMJ28 [Daucus carota subsp. sativus]|uniref:lysine-specific demethylase JMJ28 n=1 Tax=Daucus carota subsp. sativus TaxID=79200 RepID=UPI0007E029AC|nr:PREDICTED: lysine-specific demethylase JMJ25-like [Daucus carota subsp. sativus]XP_017223214.1 PREDICTED: lysine-specific demethylase JMJ25-like [Daucus carota subsp. sativus]